MSHHFLTRLFFPVILLLAGFSGSVVYGQNPKSHDTDLPNVLILGDSISMGYTPHVKTLLADTANVQRPNANCGNTKMGITHLDQWLGDTKWDVIHFNWGLWDINRRVPPNQDNQGKRDKINGGLSFTPEEYAANLEKIVERLKKTGAQLIWCNISHVPDGEEGRMFGDDLIFNHAAEKVMQKHHIPINDINTLTRYWPASARVAPGDVHYTQDGYKKIAAQVADTIRLRLAGTFEMPKDTVLVEAEGFDTKGGWVVDQQYMDQMGSPVLLAHGLGEPVADAVTQLTFPKAGEYRVFVRTRNWVARWAPDLAFEQIPGKFQLVLDGKTLPETFGAKNDAWHWQNGGTINVTQDKLTQTVALHDLTGFDGRCDAILFTADPAFTPPENIDDLTVLRRKMLGLTDDPLKAPNASEGPFDLVVCGGGIAGMCAAVSAARLDMKVALVQNRPILGGNNSSEVRVHLMGRTHYPPYVNLGNLVYELDPLQTGNAQQGDVYKDEKKLSVVNAEKNLTLFLSTHIMAAEMDENAPADAKRIKAVIGKNIETNQEYRLEGKWFADCTGDGTLAFLADAQWRMGRESKALTGESLAPENPDHLVMGASTQWYSVNANDENGKPVESSFPELPWAVAFNEESIKPALEGEWDWETGLNLNQVTDAERIRDHALRAVYGHWAYMKNQSAPEWREKAKHRKLGWVAFIAGKRESRRVMGDVILQEQDIVQREMFEDACVTTTWTIDLHYPTEHQKEHFPGEEFRTWADHKRIQPYMIPYRCFYSKDVSNLFMAGRCISVTHVALGTIRVQRTGGMMGEVVGMAASLCKKHDTTPRGVYKNHLSELKELMLVGIAPHPAEYYSSARPHDLPVSYTAPVWLKDAGKNLALNAKISVSSLYQTEAYSANYINDGKFDISNNAGRWVSEKSFEPHWVELAFASPTQVNALRLVTGQSGEGTPILDFVLQYKNDAGEWVDIEATRTKNNSFGDYGKQFDVVTAREFRLWITATPGDLARIWELELYQTK